MGLNPQQLAAVRHFETPLLVLAGAGSGKTGVITQKIAWLIEKQNYSPTSIIAVTFTNKASNEMRARLKKQLSPQQMKGLTIATFHRLGMEMLHKDGEAIGLRKGFTILDQHDSMTALRELIREGNSAIEERDLQNTISNWKNEFITPEGALAAAVDDNQRVSALLYARYNELLRACNSVDFDDLISLPVEMLREHTDVRDKWRGKVRHMLVDEYQDTNAAQYELVRQLVDKFGAFTAVGDDDQSIYSWRGAKPENLMNLKIDYPNLRVIKLEQNYRSSQRILRCANAVISHNPHEFEKALWSDLGLGDPLRVSACKHTLDEAEWVAAEILTRHYQKDTRWGDFAILYRSNFQSRAFEQALREKQIPYSISGGSSFFDKAEIKDMLAYLKLLVNPDDDTAFMRCINTPRREIGPSTLAKLGQHARNRNISMFAACHDIGLETQISGRPLQRLQRFANWLTLSADNAERGDTLAVVKGVFEDIDYTDWLQQVHDSPPKAQRAIENTGELLAWIERLLTDEDQKDQPLSEVVRSLCLHDMLSRQDDESDDNQVQMMTLHAAKGLEYPHVFMVGMEEELLPHRNSVEADTIEEERRLCYVGMTRARHTLTFTRSRARQQFGETGACEPSRFLADLPPDDVIFMGELDAGDAEASRAAGKDALKGLMNLLAAD
ncbi:UvrD-helicase domain-containing protein [Granulosicoccus sp. 3-233]|uniref:UvrD-helicase domain-containing protein n=1 Tax=Granulosicoccus sp. 3-233 TaxID=3417969 RepID=UPI003D328FA2